MTFKEGDRRLQRHGGWTASMNVVEVPVEKISIGERRRQDFGDIGALAAGIKKVGLLEPIIVDGNQDEGWRLVCGERRLQAVKMLKWETIPAQLRDRLSDDELREIELEENENRKSLTERERTRTLASSKKVLEHARKAGEVSPQSAAKPQGGRPTKYGKSKDEVAQDLGISKDTLERAEHHVETAEQFPFMQAGNWRQSDVLRVRERIEDLPQEERGPAADVLGCAKLLDPGTAVELVENIVAKKPEERRQIYDLAHSEDPRKRSLALTEAAKLPPMPDPRLGILDNALRFMNAAIKPYPADPLTPQLIQIRADIQKVRAAVKEVSYDARRVKGATVQ